jgi:hypothetical protein
MKPKLEEVRKTVLEFLSPLGMSARVHDEGANILIEPDTRKTGKLKSGKLDGMQIWYYGKGGVWEVSEEQAGNKENELLIYETTKSLKVALKGLLKGNNRKATRVYK